MKKLSGFLILIFVIVMTSQLLFASDAHHKKHKAKHHKKSHKHHVAKTHHKGKIHHVAALSKGRYKLVAFHKNGKLKHKYIDTKPKEDLRPPDDLYPEAPPSIPMMETQFAPNHPAPEREPSAINTVSSAEVPPPPQIQ